MIATALKYLLIDLCLDAAFDRIAANFSLVATNPLGIKAGQLCLISSTEHPTMCGTVEIVYGHYLMLISYDGITDEFVRVIIKMDTITMYEVMDQDTLDAVDEPEWLPDEDNE